MWHNESVIQSTQNACTHGSWQMSDPAEPRVERQRGQRRASLTDSMVAWRDMAVVEGEDMEE